MGRLTVRPSGRPVTHPELAARLVGLLGAEAVVELGGGHQSRVFRVVGVDGLATVAKVLDAAAVDRAELEVRLDVTAELADLDPRVCRPLLVDGRRVTDLTLSDGTGWYVVASELADGVAPDPARAGDAQRMGSALRRLHDSMSRLPPSSLPVVPALRSVAVDDVVGSHPHQLVHGDFNASNLRMTAGTVRIFDLDECGYAPTAFDVANALYMVLFDATVGGHPDVAAAFRRSFLAGYAGPSGPAMSEALLTRLIDLRVAALGAWLDDLEHAPIGIRTASDAWRATLRAFVADHRAADR